MRSFVVSALAIAGCANDHESVHGKWVDRFYTTHGTVERPSDLSRVWFQVFSNGQWYPPSGPISTASDGTIYITDVPSGPYVLRAVTETGASAWSGLEDHDFTRFVTRVGRPDALPATDAPLHLQLDGLTTWKNVDHLVANCWENGSEINTPVQSVGATSLDATFNWGGLANYGPYLMEASAGDTLTVSRLSTELQGNLEVSRVTQVVSGPAESQRNGEPSSFAGAFVDVPADRAQTFSVVAPSFAAQIPSAENLAWGVSLLKSPSSIAFDWFGPTLTSVVRLDALPADSSTTVSQMYGDPFDPSWQLIAVGGYGGDAVLSLPGGATTFFTSAFHSYETRYADGSNFVFEPTVEPVRSGTLDGEPMTGDIHWNGASPLTLHVDTAGAFSAEVYRLTSAGVESWTYISSETSDMTLPSDAFRIGEYFVLRVHVDKHTDASHAGAYSLLGPFRLIPN